MVNWGDIIAYTIIITMGVTIYLKKTQQTFPELIKKIIEAFRSMEEEFGDGY